MLQGGAVAVVLPDTGCTAYEQAIPSEAPQLPPKLKPRVSSSLQRRLQRVESDRGGSGTDLEHKESQGCQLGLEPSTERNNAANKPFHQSENAPQPPTHDSCPPPVMRSRSTPIKGTTSDASHDDGTETIEVDRERWMHGFWKGTVRAQKDMELSIVAAYALLGQQLGTQITAGPGVPPASAAAVKDGDVLSADASGVVPRRKASGKRSKLPQGLPPPLPPDIDPMPPPSNVPRVVPRVVPMQSADGVATSRPPAPGDARSSAPTSDRKSDGGSRRNSHDKKSDGGSRRHSYDKDSLPGRLAQMLRRLEPQKVSRPATPAPAPLEEPRLAPSQGTGALFDPSQAPHRQARWVGAQQVPTLRPQQQLDEASAPASLTLASLDPNVPMGPQTANHDAPKPKVRRTRSFQLVRRLIRGGSQPSRPPIVPQPPPECTPDDESLRLQQFAISPCVTPPSTPSRKARLEASGFSPGSLKRPESEAPPIRRTISFQTTLKRAVGLQRAGPRDSQMPRAAEPTATASSRSAFFAPISPTPQCVTPPSTPSRKAREDAAGETADMQGISETEPEAPETETESEVPPLRRTQSFQATLRRVVGLRKEAQRETAASRYANGTTIPHVGLHDHRAPRP